MTTPCTGFGGRCRTLAWWALAFTLVMAWSSVGLAADRPADETGEPVARTADVSIQASLEAAFGAIEQFRNVTVSVDSGVVKLGGEVRTFTGAQKAVELASRIDGVVYVVDAIEVETDVDARLEPVWSNLRDLYSKAIEIAPLVAVALSLFLALALVGWLVSSWDWLYKRFSGKVLLQSLVRQLVLYCFLLAGVLTALEVLELTALIGAVVGAAGLFGLGLGFAFKEIVENYVAGFLLSIRSPFSFMDWIEVDGQEGSVVRVTSRELVLMTLQGNHVRIPNAQVFKSVITNYTRNPLRRFDIELGIGVGEDLAEVQRIGCDVLRAMNGVVADPGPVMRNLEFGDFAMLVRFSGWVDQAGADFLKVRSEAVRILKESLDQADVDVPAPIQTVINTTPEEERSEVRRRPHEAAELLEEAERADVGRETFLDEQIEQDRHDSDEEDLLERGKGRRKRMR